MSLKIRAAVAGAIALALAGTAMANTSIDALTTGDVFVNVVDTTNNTSFLFDTGVSQASFNSAGSYSFNFSADTNYQAFVTGQKAGDVLDYSVLSSTQQAPNTAGTILFTTNQNTSAVSGVSISSAVSNINAFLNGTFGANTVTAAGTTSANLGAANTWGQTAYEYTVTTNLGLTNTQPGTGLDALPGTALNFYKESSTKPRSATPTGTTLTTLAGTWNYANGIATYGSAGGGGSVPLPAPVVLLMSGLGLMGVFGRRNKGTDMGMAAA